MSRKESLQHTFPWSTLGGSYHDAENRGYTFLHVCSWIACGAYSAFNTSSRKSQVRFVEAISSFSRLV